jgi:hypothetical protein
VGSKISEKVFSKIASKFGGKKGNFDRNSFFPDNHIFTSFGQKTGIFHKHELQGSLKRCFHDCNCECSCKCNCGHNYRLLQLLLQQQLLIDVFATKTPLFLCRFCCVVVVVGCWNTHTCFNNQHQPTTPTNNINKQCQQCNKQQQKPTTPTTTKPTSPKFYKFLEFFKFRI